VPVDADFVVVNSREWSAGIAPRVRTTLLAREPVEGRDCRRIGDWFLCGDAETLATLAAWRRGRRRAGARRALGAPGRAVTRVRPRVGEVVYRLRRKLPF
jgi:hypothetical protein